MSFKFIHTADWQIGKVFRFVDETTMGLLQEARLDAISRLGKLAQEHNVGHVLVAGDVYDKEALSPLSRNKPIERMRAFSKVQWHLLPGNHDPHRPNGLWDQLVRNGLPENVHVHVNPKPVCLEPDVAFCCRRHFAITLGTTEPSGMDDAETAGVIRIGLPRYDTDFGASDKDVANLISPQRPTAANLSYLALGDWHGQKKINERCWYSGTHEIDSFDVINGGQALLLEMSGPEAAPETTPLQTGIYCWKTVSEQVNGQAMSITWNECVTSASRENLGQFELKAQCRLRIAALRAKVRRVSAAFCFLQVNAGISRSANCGDRGSDTIRRLVHGPRMN